MERHSETVGWDLVVPLRNGCQRGAWRREHEPRCKFTTRDCVCQSVLRDFGIYGNPGSFLKAQIVNYHESCVNRE